MPREWPRVPTDVKGKKWPGEGGDKVEVAKEMVRKTHC